MEEDLKLSMEEVKEVEMEIKLEYLIVMMMVAIYMVPLLVKMFRLLYLMLLWCLWSKKMHRSLHTKGSQ
jgi:phosphatidylserine synthase